MLMLLPVWWRADICHHFDDCLCFVGGRFDGMDHAKTREDSCIKRHTPRKEGLNRTARKGYAEDPLNHNKGVTHGNERRVCQVS